MPLYNIQGQTVLFIHVPKAGGSSVEEWLDPFRIGLQDRRFYEPAFSPPPFPCSPQHFHRALLDSLFRQGRLDYSFALVRSPISRMASEYRFQKMISPTLDSFPAMEPWMERCFKQYRHNPFSYDNHIRPMSQFVSEQDEVFRLEDGVGAVVARLSERCPQAIAPRGGIPHVNKTPGEPQEGFTEGTLALIKDFYREDFQRWYPDQA